jgi:hypothetical protein
MFKQEVLRAGAPSGQICCLWLQRERCIYRTMKCFSQAYKRGDIALPYKCLDDLSRLYVDFECVPDRGPYTGRHPWG